MKGKPVQIRGKSHHTVTADILISKIHSAHEIPGETRITNFKKKPSQKKDLQINVNVSLLPVETVNK